ncbi:MAG: hypothetical protein HDQ89_10410 [Desulfovibrio sp.]|nr:hypothetical protein [Desulfovibrio sp.]
MLAELPLLARYTVTADDAVYAIPFRVYRAEDVAVTFSTNGRTETALTLGKDYSVQILPAGGAELTLAAGVAGGVVPAGAVLAIASAVPATQEADFSNTATVNTGALETQLDREVQMIQQLKDGLALAVKVPAAGNQSPEDLLADIFDAKDSAADSATSAQANANAAAESARAAAGSAAIATEEREAACICAGEAKDARDVAIAQTEAANTLMEAELAKVNAIVAANRTDQQAAVTRARQWAEKAPDTPVDYDEEGNPRYSARHWAENAQKIAIEPPTAERRGSIRVGAGLHLETGENGDKDVLTADLATQEAPGRVQPDGVTTTVDEEGLLTALGGNLLLNEEEWITVSGTWTAKATGWHELFLINGGMGGMVSAGTCYIKGGNSGSYDRIFVYLEKGQETNVTIGAGGLKRVALSGAAQWPPKGGLTYFGTYTARFNNEFSGHIHYTQSSAYAHYGAPGGFGADSGSSAPRFYGAGGGVYYRSTTDYAASDGASGAICARWHDPAKANGPLPEPALLTARRLASRAAATPVTVNLYDPETGQGSIWREEDAPAQLAKGLITQEAWMEICAARAAEDYAAWLSSPDTEEERFELLRMACEARLTATDKMTTPDYPISDEVRAAVNAYRKAVRELNHQPGAPWDGGGEATPWPVEPVVTKVQEEE